MRYCIEYIRDGKQKSYTRGGRISIHSDDEGPHPANSNGKVYHLSYLQYEQARRWVLKHSPENAEWEE
ncbi:hypothetical protein BVC80_8823g14 [Macleaya cordata]|uniref:Uncharacterized protein n=1 Tax=Macleaya cordata TaxID=56857 RepID=A0A200QFY0_MACCD|nr:hypothetical protein BVC80_8823g14 [Macleaya cordata]